MWLSFEWWNLHAAPKEVERQLRAFRAWIKESLISAAGTRTSNSDVVALLPGMGVRPDPTPGNEGKVVRSSQVGGCSGANMRPSPSAVGAVVYCKCEGEIDVLMDPNLNPAVGTGVYLSNVTDGYFSDVAIGAACGIILDRSMYAATQRVRIQGMFPRMPARQ